MKRETLASWREKLGLSQKVLAEYLGISRGLVNLVERGERDLPIQAFVLFTQLIRHYEAATPASIPQLFHQAARQKNWAMLNQLIAEISWQLTKLRQELATMEADYAQARLQLHVFQTTQQEVTSDGPAQQKQRLWLRMREEEAWRKLANTSPDARLPLQLRIKTLQASLQAAQQILQTFPGELPSEAMEERPQ